MIRILGFLGPCRFRILGFLGIRILAFLGHRILGSWRLGVVGCEVFGCINILGFFGA